jgi:2-hydroxy-3-oxopropionate reductase
MKQRIGYIGLGLMGGSLARHLLSAGFSVTVLHADTAKVKAIVKAGAKTVSAPDQMAAQVDVIILSLPNSQVVSHVVNDSLRLFETGRKGLIVLDTSTADPAISAKLAATLRHKGIEMLDSTISGTSTMCAAKESLFMVGGKKQVFEQCVPLFAAMSREWVYMGENGTGAAIKLVVNLVLALNRMALAEGLTLAKKAGLDQLQTLEVLKKSAAYSKSMDQKGQRMVTRHFVPPEGPLEMHYKDIQLMLDLGARLDCPLPLLSLNAQALAAEIAKGRGGWDTSDIISYYDDLANI